MLSSIPQSGSSEKSPPLRQRLSAVKIPQAGRTYWVAGSLITIIFILIALAGPLLVPEKQERPNLEARLLGPSRAHPLGTDEVGRDILSRLVMGSRISISIAISAVGLATIAGVALGLLSGSGGPRWDMLIMRLVDVLLTFPSLVLAIAIVSVAGVGSVTGLVIAIALTEMPRFARLARAATLTVNSTYYVMAAHSLGASRLRIMRRHILPNILSPIIVQVTLGAGVAILTSASLSFLGLGVQPPLPEWGAMLSRGRAYMRVAPHVVAFPGLTIAFLVLGFNLLGDGLRELLDPRMRGLLK